jgi:hypothetical protein
VQSIGTSAENMGRYKRPTRTEGLNAVLNRDMMITHSRVFRDSYGKSFVILLSKQLIPLSATSSNIPEYPRVYKVKLQFPFYFTIDYAFHLLDHQKSSK